MKINKLLKKKTTEKGSMRRYIWGKEVSEWVMSWGRTSRISKYKGLEVPVSFKERKRVERVLLEWNRQGRGKQGMKLEKQWARAEHEGLYRNFRSWAFTKNVIGRFLSRRVTLSDLCFISITLTCVLRIVWMVSKMEDGRLVGRLLQ